MSFFRPFIDKLKNFKFAHWIDFFRERSRETNWPLVLLLPKIAWGMWRGFNFREFPRYQLTSRTWSQMASYHSTFDNVRLINRLNREENLGLLRDKGRFLKRFPHRLGREFVDLRETSESEFGRFVARHPLIVAKPFNLARGAGIEVIDLEAAPVASDALYQRLRENEMYVIEAFLPQHEALSQIYPLAINSLRLTTLLTGTEAKIVLPPTIRFGSKGGRIDFLGSIVAMVDRENGNRLVGITESKGGAVTRHPDTDADLTLLRVPFMEEAEALVLAAARELPEIRYVGWDVAFTPTGPVLIEGNGAPDPSGLQEIMIKTSGWGCRKRLATLR